MKILVINGPNLNLLGLREPAVYGSGSYTELVSYVNQCAEALGLSVTVVQSNHEGVLVDKIQEALGRFDAIVINPAAYTHTSVAILDALLAVGLPAVEVHLSEPLEREAFRHVSYAGLACEKRFAGQSFDSYRLALEYLSARDGADT